MRSSFRYEICEAQVRKLIIVYHGVNLMRHIMAGGWLQLETFPRPHNSLIKITAFELPTHLLVYSLKLRAIEGVRSSSIEHKIVVIHTNTHIH